MKALLLVVVLTGTTATTVLCQEQTTLTLPKINLQGNEVYDTLSQDELQFFYSELDKMSTFDLKKYRESFIYRRRMNPCVQNREVVLYIEEKLKQQ